MTVRVASVVALSVALSVPACRPSPQSAPTVSVADDPAAPHSSSSPSPGLEPVDAGRDPCDDFYQYACGPWLAARSWPSDAPVWARSFSGAEQQTQARLRGLLGDLANSADPEQAQIGRYWQQCLDEPGRIAAGFTAIAPLWDAIDALKPRELPALLGQLHAHGIPALFQIRRPERTGELSLWLGTTGLGTAKMYEPKAPRLAPYRAHVTEMFRLAGFDGPERRAEAVITFETALTRVQPTREEILAAENTKPTPLAMAALRKEARAFAWDRYFAALGQPTPASVVVKPGGFAAMLAVVGRTDIAVLRDYLRWQTLRHTAAILPPVLAAENYRMFDPSSAVAGREANCIKHAEAAFGPALGRLYGERHVPVDDRTRVRGMVERMRAQLRGEVERAAWIETAAKSAILGYLDGLKIEVAEPPPLPPPVAPADSFLATSLARRKARIAAELAGTAERTLPATAVNGRMADQKVELFAGILQSPFYSPDLPEPVLLGALGQIVAHEIGHAVDPQSMAQEIGVESMPGYEARLQCVSDSYSRNEVAPGVFADGPAMARESFADNVGLRIAHGLVAERGRAAERQFFVAWAQLLCTHYTPEMLPLMAGIDVAPAPVRVNQPLRLFPGFAAAFECAEGTPMRPRDACSPW